MPKASQQLAGGQVALASATTGNGIGIIKLSSARVIVHPSARNRGRNDPRLAPVEIQRSRRLAVETTFASTTSAANMRQSSKPQRWPRGLLRSSGRYLELLERVA
jgi:hypothetical protein